ncbi:hypothetical protein Rleg4DRAFT_2475 [Rhizobium leguminosarum bv. trifolii WSM2297]|uniref:Uncharacterized protein n=1 Tax=Rhizobium leguminosarum bv. trifolii WSM2297 TaxID=754762 RepID=J0W6N0_RHILT|nr:hypothetical protein Rleg4DRAFT_2475 [Rhizobium leguminosarum bv. trifolii WSM2297]
MSSIKDTFQYMVDLDGLNGTIPRGKQPSRPTRHKREPHFSFAGESDHKRPHRRAPLSKWRYPS